ncbi:putative transporter YclF [Weizmannia acidilactici]|jgi:POT family proton-dependent oligopeptide transporter|uniref:Transporter YclF n=1 Tax=Weizmannia acidilactici TaxID=2607726 RepID=A0A5J4J6X3_9BACI|nr:peptide MFS transporter [Weizmannia acidilactici]GER66673.1 putative transporter YclF [Weizmannia acidilactici]GER70672.1 putative transporter YclF [Weizmannia acidilactici]GER72828.1 putative transporter YclF [Weizmannia acidilactici]
MSAIIDRKKILETVPQTGFFGHPKGLSTLFFTEFWERFSYYGMKGILIYYMYDRLKNGGLGLDPTTAASIASIYGALVYMSGIIGGWVSDRLLGSVKTVFYGGVLIMLGHIALAIPAGFPALIVSMVLIVLGTGLLKPNAASTVGELYDEKDLRRDSGFSIYYMAVNLGAFLAPLIVGTVGQKYNYHLGFSIAAVGMFLGLVAFSTTRKKYLGLAGSVVHNPLTPDEKKSTFMKIGLGTIGLIIILAATIPTGILNLDRFITLVSILGFLIPAWYFVMMYFSKKSTRDERSRLLAYIPLFIASIVFWAIEEQGASLLAVYADKRTQLDFGGFHILPSWFQTLNPLFIVVFAPVLASLWMKLGDRQPSTPVKFSFGLIFAGLSFIVMMAPAYFNGSHTLVNPLWLVLSYFLVVIGELCLSPVGLSVSTKLAPAAFSAQMLSLWNLSDAAAQTLNAQLVKMYDANHEVMYFGVVGLISAVLGVFLLLYTPVIKRLMRGVK